MVTLAQSFDANSIAKIVEIALLIAFIALIVFFVIAIVIGLFRGVFASVFRLFMMLALILTAVFTLDLLVNAIGAIDLSGFFKYVVITNQSTGQSITVAVSNLFNTLSDGIGAAMYLAGYQADVITISQMAVSLTTMILKFVVIFIDMILILIFGNLFVTLLWHIGFKRLIPKFVRKIVKIRWLSAILDGVRYVVVAIMLISPLTAIVNSVNQSWQKYKPDTNNPTVQSIGTFLDTYNNSLLAKTLFNWTYNSETGLTFDSQLISAITSTSFGDGEMSIIELLNSLGSVGGAALKIFENTDTYNIASLLTTESLIALFESLNNFAIIPYLLPLGFTLALNANTMTGLDLSALEIDSIDWNKELETLETIIIDINNTGILSNFIDENGSVVETVQLEDILKSMFTDEAYTYTCRVFETIDNSQLLSQILPLVMSYVASSSPEVGMFLPTSYQECKAIKWGFELSVIYDNLFRLFKVDDTILDLFLDMAAPQAEPQSVLDTEGNESTGGIDPELLDAIIRNIDSIKVLFVGQFDRNGNLINCNNEGYSLAKSRSDIPLFDLNIVRGMFRPLVEIIIDTLTSSDINNYASVFEDAFDQLFEGHVVKNFKVEFGAIFACLKDMSKNDLLMDAVMNNNFDALMEVNKKEANTLASIVEGLDRSKIVSSILKPILDDLLRTEELKQSLETIGLKADDFKILECENICHELATIVRALPSINNVSTLVEDPDVMKKIGNYTEDIAFVLDTVFVSEILNPDFDAHKDNNFYRVLEIVFDLVTENGITGLTFKREEVNQEIGYQKWNNSLTPEGDYPRDNKGRAMYDGEIGDLVNTLNALCFENVTIGSPFRGMTLFECFSDPSVNMTDLVSRLEKEFHISEVFACVEESALIKPTFGDFLDERLLELGDIGLIDISAGRTFNNVENWADEGLKFGQMCNIMGDIDVDLANLNLLDFNNFDALNRLLHSMADLSLFIDPEDKVHGTTINDFLFDKIKDALVTDDMDLLSDETSTETEKTFFKAREDFQVAQQDGAPIVAMKEDWCSSTWMDQYMDDSTIHDIDSSFYDGDLISQACRVIKSLDEMKKATEVITGSTYENYIQALTSGAVPSSVLQIALTYINEYQPLRMVIYHSFDLVFGSVDTGGLIDFSNINTNYLALDSTDMDMRQYEIDGLMFIYDFYLNNLKDNGTFDFESFVKEPESVVELYQMVSTFVSSYVFHRAGPESGSGFTSFQSLMNYILGVEGLKTMLYSDDPLSKDQSSKYSSLYSDVDSKIKYMVGIEHFDYQSDNDIQQDKIDDMFEVISSFVAGPIDIKNASVDDDFSIPGSCYEGLLNSSGDLSFDFSSIDISTVSTSAMKDILVNLNNSDLLYEMVPNSLDTIFESNTTGLLYELAASSDPFYAYYLNDIHNPDYNARYSEKEIDNLCELIDHFEEMNEYISDGDVTQLLTLSDAEFDIFISELDNMFGNLYSSYVFHQFNNINQIEEFSAFENFVEKIFIDTSIYTLIYNPEVDDVKYNPYGSLSTDDASKFKLEDAIRRLSEQDYNYHFVTGALNTVGLSDVWYDDNDVTNDEIKAFVNFMKAIKKLEVTDLSSFTIDLEDTDVFNPDNISSIFFSLNRVDIAEGSVGHLMKQLMNESNMSTYSSYEGVDYAAYFLTQREYDSEGGLGTIDRFLRNVAIYDEDGNFESYNVLNKNASDPFTQYVEKGKSTTYILEFITKSLLYTHDEIELNCGEKVMDDAILFYNLFTPNNPSVANISDYIYGDTKDEKILTLNHIIHHFDYHPEYDGNAIDVLLLGNFNDSTFDAEDFDSVKALRESIYSAIVALTHDDGDINNPERGRAFIASEILSGLLDKFIDSEIATNNASLSQDHPFYIDEDYFQVRKCIEDREIESYLDINEESYELLNVDEARGINAVLKMYAGNTFEDYLLIDRPMMVECFEDMEYEITRTNINSRFASLIYISRIRDVFDTGFMLASFLGYNQTYKINSAADLLDYNVGFINFGNDVIGAIETIAPSGI